MSDTGKLVAELRCIAAYPHDIAGAQDVMRAAADRLAAVEKELSKLKQPNWYYQTDDGEFGSCDVSDVIEDMDYEGVMEVSGANEVWKKWIAKKCLTVDADGYPDEETWEEFDTAEEAEKCWPDSLAAAIKKAFVPE